jgi:hypothetical protein
MKREMSVTPWQASAPSERITQAYLAALGDPSTLAKLEDLLATTLQPLPNPKRVLQEKQDLSDKLQATRSLLQ